MSHESSCNQLTKHCQFRHKSIKCEPRVYFPLSHLLIKMVDLVIVKSVIQWLLYLISGSIAILFIIKGGAILNFPLVSLENMITLVENAIHKL